MTKTSKSVRDAERYKDNRLINRSPIHTREFGKSAALKNSLSHKRIMAATAVAANPVIERDSRASLGAVSAVYP